MKKENYHSTNNCRSSCGNRIYILVSNKANKAKTDIVAQKKKMLQYQ
jgi:hypothetical protein